jgi:hypothetical protein
MANVGFAARIAVVGCAMWIGCASLVGGPATPPVVVLRRHIALDPPPGEILGALAIGDRLLVPDNLDGHIREYGLDTGKQTAERGVLGDRPGELTRPMWVFVAGGGFGVDDWGRGRIILFDRDWSFKSEVASRVPTGYGFSFLAPPLWLGDRITGAGVGHPEVFGGREFVYLFAARVDGTLIPLLWRDNPSNLKAELSSPIYGGGVADLGAAGWVFLDPSTDEYRVFDSNDREVRRFKGEASHWSAPDLASRPTGRDRAEHFEWLSAQAALGQPLKLGGGRIATLVRGRPASGAVSYVLEVYDVKTGTFLGSAELPLPNEQRHYLLRAPAEAGRLVVVLRDGWQSGSTTEVFDFRVGAGGPGATPAGRQ